MMSRKFWLSPESAVYLVMWLLIFLLPIAIFYLRAATFTQAVFHWDEVLHTWQWFLYVFLCFLIHNFLLAPLLLSKKKVAYMVLVALLFVFFYLLSTTIHGPRPHNDRQPECELNDNGTNTKASNTQMAPPPRFDDHRPGPLGREILINTVLLSGVLGLNIGIKFYFKSEQDRNHLQQLEKERMFLQLQYLKFQINPHFFMNTLNNIQVLIDMDAEKAKECLRELSVMMRFVLYDGDKNRVSLHKDILFLRNYVKLMRLRYNSRLTVTIDIPDNLPDYTIPPLIFPTFVENAFKHGVSYKQDSFINIAMDIEDGELLFSCINSKKPMTETSKVPSVGGVGLTNVRRRLDLIYGDRYTLDIKDKADVYNVLLRLPIQKD
ncbi:sensor histidine kinase [Hallella mizrahii]|uniref:Histidine kinase n=1 Tax=Hallella mizrahii TaxID=2606637 RepID=A0A7K0KDK8_9BACT|nr:histidine kinase [Hallella mizrahii]MST83939.1 histidine kinase [Hallella mizrahii]